MATKSEFTPEERNLLIRLPRWVAGAASAAHHEGLARTRQKLEKGFLSVANGRKAANPLIAELAAGTVRVYDEDPNASGIDPSTEAGTEQIIQYALTAVTILRAKADPPDARAYRRFLLAVTDDVITGMRNELLGIGGAQVHPKEREFRDRLAAITRPAPPAA